MRNDGYTFTTIVHPSAVLEGDVNIEEGAQILAGVVIQPGTSIGKDTIINSGVILDHDCNIEKNCHSKMSI